MPDGGKPLFTPFPGGPVVRRGRNPLEISMLAVFLLSGVVGLLNPSSASPLLQQVFGKYVWTWHFGLIAGTTTALIGILIFKPLTDVLIERIGMVWLATCFLAYGTAVCVQDDALFTTYTGVILGLGLAFAARAWQITRDLQRLHRVLQALPERESSPDT